MSWQRQVVIGLKSALVATVGGGLVGVQNYISTGTLDWHKLGAAFLAGATGALAAYLMPPPHQT